MNDLQDEARVTNRVSLVTILGNFSLAVFKFIAGILARSQALISDAIDSLGDVFSGFIVLIGLRVSHKQSDDDHPFGHERFESVATILLSILLFGSGVFIGYGAISDIVLYFRDGIVKELSDLTTVALIAAAISIVGKEAMFWYTRHHGKKISSEALIASAWNYRMDALSSVGALVGIIGAMCGLPILDAFAGAIICVFILITAIKIFVGAINRLVDRSCDDETMQKIRETILQVEGVMAIDVLKTRLFGSRIYVDVEISVDGDQSVKEGHQIAENVHDCIEKTFVSVKHCMVHVNPAHVIDPEQA